MPRDMQETITLSDLDQLIGSITQNNLRVQFEATHLDVVASKLNDVFQLTGDDQVDRQDVLDVLYADIYGESVFASGLDVVKELNTAHIVETPNKDVFISNFVTEDEKEYKRVKAQQMPSIVVFAILTVPACIFPPLLLLTVTALALSADKLEVNKPKTRRERATKTYEKDILAPYETYQSTLEAIKDRFQESGRYQEGQPIVSLVKKEIKQPKFM